MPSDTKLYNPDTQPKRARTMFLIDGPLAASLEDKPEQTE
jgi:hypothetical protein